MIARQTYPEFFAMIGARPAFVRERGPAYPRTVSSLSALLREIGVMGPDFAINTDMLIKLKTVNFESSSADLPDTLRKVLLGLSPDNQAIIADAIHSIMEGTPWTP